MVKKQIDIWQDPAKEIGEALLDQALEKSAPGLAKIPLLSTLIAAMQSGNAWSDYLLARKVQQFYSAWEMLATPERKKIYEKFQTKPREFVEKLLFILDKQEDGEKCQLLGKLTIYYLKGKIRRADYYDLIETIAQLTLGDLQKFASLFAHKSLLLPESKIGERYVNTFLARGLVASAPRIPREQRLNDNRSYQLTKIGIHIAELFNESED